VGGVVIGVGAPGRPIAGGRRAFVPVRLEPAQRVDDVLDVLVGGPRAVGVLDAQDERPAVMPRVEPVEERRARAADVEVTRGAGREAYANLAWHGLVLRDEPAPPRGGDRADAQGATE